MMFNNLPFPPKGGPLWMAQDTYRHFLALLILMSFGKLRLFNSGACLLFGGCETRSNEIRTES